MKKAKKKPMGMKAADAANVANAIFKQMGDQAPEIMVAQNGKWIQFGNFRIGLRKKKVTISDAQDLIGRFDTPKKLAAYLRKSNFYKVE